MAKKNSKKTSQPKAPLSAKKKALFYTITLSIPVLFFLILEIVLRSVNYLGNTELFYDPGIGNEEYLMPNPNFAARYFFYTKTIPNPSIDAFLKEKPENGFRVFAMGGSSAAGYPYGFNGTHSRVVQDVLSDAMPDRQVEIVNLGISAISSYTLFDQVDEILDHDPDAIIIYAGHNEFYGALGVGSNENLGAFPGFVRFYLKMQRFKTFMLLRTIIVDSGIWLSEKFSGEKVDQSATLMERIVNSRSIELGSPQYQLAIGQFDSNLNAIIKKFERQGIPVFIGSVASNLKDHPPFVSIEDGDEPSAQEIFEEAQSAYEIDNFRLAEEKFRLAKDLDGLKFRAPTEINEIIASKAEEFENTIYVPTLESFESNSPDEIIGFELMLEHLHPNQEGYFLIGETFSKAMLNYYRIAPPENIDVYFDQMQFSEFDTRVGWHRVETLKQSFPFVLGEKPTPYQFSYRPSSIADSLALKVVHSSLRWDEAKVELAEFYTSTRENDKALREYYGLIRNQPWNESPYIFAARILLDQNNFAGAEPLLTKAYEINPDDAFVTKMLGAIEVQKGNASQGVAYLEASRRLNPRDVQMLYNLSGAYFNDGQLQKALETADRALELSPNFPGLRNWRQQLMGVINQQRGE